ncbi:uncharacterized protein V1516DRAFT_634887 [Lipomyces oligophaga]|uniref:uncharacterized protein n=1 Tax=Lipomyces oligophaga TaxID=45792 RepID=UPI0034CF53C4
MFVFPANDDGYRKRKKSFKACDQCKKGRRRCQPSSLSNGQCTKCARDNLRCSLVSDMSALIPRKDQLQQQQEPGISLASHPPPLSRISPPGRHSPPNHFASTKPISPIVVTSMPETPGILRTGLTPSLSLPSPLPHTQSMAIPFGSNSMTPPSIAVSASSSLAPKMAPRRVNHSPPTITSISALVNPSDSEIRPPVEATPMEPETTDTPPRRFISNLDPTSELVMAGEVDDDKIGVWLASDNASDKLDDSQRRTIHVPPPVNSQMLVYLNTLHAFEMPSEQDREGLVDLYFSSINRNLPVIEEKVFRRQLARGEHSTILLHAIMLSASRHAQASKFLHGREPRDFAALTYSKVKGLLYAEMEQDSLTLIRIYALLSLHSEGPRGLSDSSRDLSMAFHHAHFSAIHLRRDHIEPSTPDKFSPIQQLWLSLWCLDHMSSCITGHPLHSHPRDVGFPVDDNGPAFGLKDDPLKRMVESCFYLDTTIDLYRPRPPETIVDIKAPRFRQNELLPRLVHSVAIILFYKRLHNLTEQLPDSTMQTLLSAAHDILSIMENSHEIAPLPILPYSITLTLTVFLRLYPSPAARAGWHRSCEMLDQLGKYWWIAEAMSSMGTRIFRKLEEDYNTISGEWALEDYISDRASTSGQIMSGVLDQATIFGELDKDVVDYWFPNMNLLEQLYPGASPQQPQTQQQQQSQQNQQNQQNQHPHQHPLNLASTTQISNNSHNTELANSSQIEKRS